jgi:hypothetical protein
MSKRQDDGRPCYVARRPCGCICIACSAWAYDHDPGNRRDLANAMRDGLSIERISAEGVRAGSWGCPTCKPTPQPVAEPSLF